MWQVPLFISAASSAPAKLPADLFSPYDPPARHFGNQIQYSLPQCLDEDLYYPFASVYDRASCSQDENITNAKWHEARGIWQSRARKVFCPDARADELCRWNRWNVSSYEECEGYEGIWSQSVYETLFMRDDNGQSHLRWGIDGSDVLLVDNLGESGLDLGVTALMKNLQSVAILAVDEDSKTLADLLEIELQKTMSAKSRRTHGQPRFRFHDLSHVDANIQEAICGFDLSDLTILFQNSSASVPSCVPAGTLILSYGYFVSNAIPHKRLYLSEEMTVFMSFARGLFSLPAKNVTDMATDISRALIESKFATGDRRIPFEVEDSLASLQDFVRHGFSAYIGITMGEDLRQNNELTITHAPWEFPAGLDADRQSGTNNIIGHVGADGFVNNPPRMRGSLSKSENDDILRSNRFKAKMDKFSLPMELPDIRGKHLTSDPAELYSGGAWAGENSVYGHAPGAKYGDMMLERHKAEHHARRWEGAFEEQAPRFRGSFKGSDGDPSATPALDGPSKADDDTLKELMDGVQVLSTRNRMASAKNDYDSVIKKEDNTDKKEPKSPARKFLETELPDSKLPDLGSITDFVVDDIRDPFSGPYGSFGPGLGFGAPAANRVQSDIDEIRSTLPTRLRGIVDDENTERKFRGGLSSRSGGAPKTPAHQVHDIDAQLQHLPPSRQDLLAEKDAKRKSKSETEAEKDDLSKIKPLPSAIKLAGALSVRPAMSRSELNMAGPGGFGSSGSDWTGKMAVESKFFDLNDSCNTSPSAMTRCRRFFKTLSGLNGISIFDYASNLFSSFPQFSSLGDRLFDYLYGELKNSVAVRQDTFGSSSGGNFGSSFGSGMGGLAGMPGLMGGQFCHFPVKTLDQTWYKLRDSKKRTFLHLAVRDGKAELVDKLLQCCTFCAIDRDGMSVLHYAAESESAPIATLVLDRARREVFYDPQCVLQETKDGWGRLPKDLARKNSNEQIAAIFESEEVTQRRAYGSGSGGSVRHDYMHRSYGVPDGHPGWGSGYYGANSYGPVTTKTPATNIDQQIADYMSGRQMQDASFFNSYYEDVANGIKHDLNGMPLGRDMLGPFPAASGGVPDPPLKFRNAGNALNAKPQVFN